MARPAPQLALSLRTRAASALVEQARALRAPSPPVRTRPAFHYAVLCVWPVSM